MKKLLEVKILADIKYVRLIKNVTNNILKKMGVSSKEKYMLNLAVAEAIANIIEHSYKYEKEKKIEYNIIGNKNEVKFILIDNGDKVDKEKIKSRELEKYEEGGLGIFLIKKAMTKVEYIHLENGTKLEMTKTFKK